MRPTRDDLLSLLDQFGELRQVSESPQVWVPSYKDKREQAHIDEISREIAYQCQRYFDNNRRFFETMPLEELYTIPFTSKIISRRYAKRRGNYNSKFADRDEFGIAKKTNTELEDIDPDEFEKVLNGG